MDPTGLDPFKLDSGGDVAPEDFAPGNGALIWDAQELAAAMAEYSWEAQGEAAEDFDLLGYAANGFCGLVWEAADLVLPETYDEMATAAFGYSLLAPFSSLIEGAGVQASAWVNKLFSGVDDAATVGSSFFDGTSYTPKVVEQMKGGPGEFHSFPEAVRAFESSGTVGPITGADGVARQMLEIPGAYQSANGNWYNGVFQFIKEASGEINHRLFVTPTP